MTTVIIMNVPFSYSGKAEYELTQSTKPAGMENRKVSLLAVALAENNKAHEGALGSPRRMCNLICTMARFGFPSGFDSLLTPPADSVINADKRYRACGVGSWAECAQSLLQVVKSFDMCGHLVQKSAACSRCVCLTFNQIDFFPSSARCLA